MLVETTPNHQFQVGDTVKVLPSGAVGKIVGFESGRWRVQINNENILYEAAQLERKQILFG